MRLRWRAVHIIDSEEGDTKMDYVRKTVDSASLYGVFDIPLALRNKKVEVIILPAEGIAETKSQKKLRLGFVKGPSLPESFFDPLPEEDLQAWGL